MSETRAQIADECRQRAAVFRAFAIETISSAIREELFMLAEGFEQLAADQLSGEGGSVDEC